MGELILSLVLLCILLFAFTPRDTKHRNGCDGKPVHRGMCQCQCDEHYFGL